jgi:hypothetical protein
MRTRLILLAGCFLGTLVFSSAVVPDTARVPREFDSRKIGRLMDPALTPRQRAVLAIDYIKEEVAHPTPPFPGLNAPITHEYILAQLVRSAAQPLLPQPAVDTDMLWNECRQARGELRDMLCLAMAYAGDRRARETVVAYLRNPAHDIFLRQHAAHALAEFDDPNMIPILLHVIRTDSAYWEYQMYRNRPPERRYLVRAGAFAGLQRMREKGTPLTPEALAELEKRPSFVE